MASVLRRLRASGGFTLVELLVVVLIIGILIAVAAPSFLAQTAKAQDSAAKQTLSIAYKAARSDAVDNPAGQGLYRSPAALVTAITASEPELTVATVADTASLTAKGTVYVVSADTTSSYLHLAELSQSGHLCELTSSANSGVSVSCSASTYTVGAPSSYTLTTVVVSQGTVTSSPSGISCGSTCSASFASGASVTLTATPSLGYTFSGWSGACSGTGSCTVTMSQAQSVTATFALPSGTVAFWNFNEGSGTTAVDASSYGNNLSLQSGASWSASTPFSSGSSLSLNGTSTGYVQKTSPQGIPTGNASRAVTIWFKTSGTGYQPLVRWGSSPSNQGFDLTTTPSGGLQMTNWYGQAAQTWATPSSVADGQWHYVAFSYDSTTDVATAYLDGVSLGGRTFSGGLNTVVDANGVDIGRSSDPFYFTGQIDQVAIYNRTLTSSEVASAWASRASAPTTTYAAQVGSSSGLLDYWKFNETSGTTASDSGSLALPLTLNGSAAFSSPHAGTWSTGSLSDGPALGYARSSVVTGLPTGNASRTVEGWFKTSSTALQGIFTYGSQASNQAFSVYVKNSTTIAFGNWGAEKTFTVPNVADNNWHYFVLSYSSSTSTASLYLDDVYYGSLGFGALATTTNTTDGIDVGRTLDNFGFVGQIDDVSFYNRTLSPAEVSSHWAGR